MSSSVNKVTKLYFQFIRERFQRKQNCENTWNVIFNEIRVHCTNI